MTCARLTFVQPDRNSRLLTLAEDGPAFLDFNLVEEPGNTRNLICFQPCKQMFTP
jgi:hypothetical protein